MKIAINCVFFQPQAGGIREYIDNLIANLADPAVGGKDEYVLYVARDFEDYARKHWADLPPNFRIKSIPFRGSGLLNRIYRSLADRHFWHREEILEHWDIFHSPFFHSHRPRKAKLLLTVHDLRLERYPKSYAFFRRVFLSRAVRRSVSSADAVISVSDFTKRELIRAYGVEETKISVIREGLTPRRSPIADPQNSLDQILPPGAKYILSVGHLEPRKNYSRLIDAFDIVASRLPDQNLHLIIVGRPGHDYASLLKKIEKNPLVHWLDFVDADTLQSLYRSARLFVFPSFYEGFGFPPLEAAREHTVSLVSGVSSMPEVCADGALYFDPFSIDDMADKIVVALSSPHLRLHLDARMQARLHSFSWRRNASLTHSLYQSVLSKTPFHKTLHPLNL